jgi:hypothetical protein
MSEVKRYDIAEYSGGMDEIVDGDYVKSADFDAAQSELAALREELARTHATFVNATQVENGKWVKRLADAERRNATLVKAATEFMEYAESGWDHFPDVGVNLRAALAQSTESGASE